MIGIGMTYVGDQWGWGWSIVGDGGRRLLSRSRSVSRRQVATSVIVEGVDLCICWAIRLEILPSSCGSDVQTWSRATALSKDIRESFLDGYTVLGSERNGLRYRYAARVAGKDMVDLIGEAFFFFFQDSSQGAGSRHRSRMTSFAEIRRESFMDKNIRLFVGGTKTGACSVSDFAS